MRGRCEQAAISKAYAVNTRATNWKCNRICDTRCSMSIWAWLTTSNNGTVLTGIITALGGLAGAAWAIFMYTEKVRLDAADLLLKLDDRFRNVHGTLLEIENCQHYSASPPYLES